MIALNSSDINQIEIEYKKTETTSERVFETLSKVEEKNALNNLLETNSNINELLGLILILENEIENVDTQLIDLKSSTFYPVVNGKKLCIEGNHKTFFTESKKYTTFSSTGDEIIKTVTDKAGKFKKLHTTGIPHLLKYEEDFLNLCLNSNKDVSPRPPKNGGCHPKMGGVPTWSIIY